jgi:hypothetical protein
MADRYWVGNTGLWDDTDHWSLTSGGVGGASIPTINDDVFIDANSFTEPGQYIEFGTPDCSNSETIGYTTLQMATSGTQTLTVTGGAVGDVYTWTTTSGSFDTSTGTSVVYTAPATNAECANNPTISLTCGGNVVDTIQIAVNANATTAVAYAIKVLTTACWTNICDPPYTCYHAQSTTNAYKCDGTQPPDGYAGCINALGFGGDCNMRYGGACSCAWVAANTGPYFGVCPTVGYGTTDLRTALMKTQGCCPAQLM